MRDARNLIVPLDSTADLSDQKELASRLNNRLLLFLRAPKNFVAERELEVGIPEARSPLRFLPKSATPLVDCETNKARYLIRRTVDSGKNPRL